MEIGKVLLPSNVTKTSFIANWSIPTNGFEYLLDVAEDKLFTSKLSGFDEKILSTNYDEVTGLSDKTKYYYRVRPRVYNVTGKAESGSSSTLTDTNMTWTVDAWIGYIVRIYAGSGIGEEAIITSNTSNTLTADFATGTLIDATSYYYIYQDDGQLSFAMEVLTGFNMKGLSIEFKSVLQEKLSLSGITFEVKSDTITQSIIKNMNGEYLSGVSILVQNTNWTKMGEWDPYDEIVPDSPVNGDFYIVNIKTYSDVTGETDILFTEGYSDITGETELFTNEDLLLYDNDTWQIKKKRNVVSNSNGISGYNIEYETDNLITVQKDTYAKDYFIVNVISGTQYIPITLKKFGSRENPINNPNILYRNNKFYI